MRASWEVLRWVGFFGRWFIAVKSSGSVDRQSGLDPGFFHWPAAWPQIYYFTSLHYCFLCKLNILVSPTEGFWGLNEVMQDTISICYYYCGIIIITDRITDGEAFSGRENLVLLSCFVNCQVFISEPSGCIFPFMNHTLNNWDLDRILLELQNLLQAEKTPVTSSWYCIAVPGV